MAIAFFALGAVGLFVGHCTLEYRKKQRLRQLAIKLNSEPETQNYKIFSCLVDLVYAADLGKHEFAQEIWTTLGYELETDIKENYGYGLENERPVRLMVFRRTKTPWQYVVAIRGTKLTSLENILDDYKIAVEKLHKSARYTAISNLIKNLVDKRGKENVCVTGHSLGAAFALLATRELALDGKFVETHLFNPPFASLDVLLKKLWNSVVRKPVAKISGTFGKKLDTTSRTLYNGFNSLGNSPDDMESRKVKTKEFAALRKWTPHLYVNHDDPICNGYCNHFDNQPLSTHHPESSRRANSAPPSLFRSRSTNSKSFHLIPSGILVTNHRSKGCHKLSQWYKHEPVRLKYERCSLLVDPEPNIYQSSPSPDENITITSRTHSAPSTNAMGMAPDYAQSCYMTSPADARDRDFSPNTHPMRMGLGNHPSERAQLQRSRSDTLGMDSSRQSYVQPYGQDATNERAQFQRSPNDALGTDLSRQSYVQPYAQDARNERAQIQRSPNGALGMDPSRQSYVHNSDKDSGFERTQALLNSDGRQTISTDELAKVVDFDSRSRFELQSILPGSLEGDSGESCSEYTEDSYSQHSEELDSEYTEDFLREHTQEPHGNRSEHNEDLGRKYTEHPHSQETEEPHSKHTEDLRWGHVTQEPYIESSQRPPDQEAYLVLLSYTVLKRLVEVYMVLKRSSIHVGLLAALLAVLLIECLDEMFSRVRT